MIINVDGDDVEVPDGTTKENADRIARMHLIRTGKLKAEVGPALTRQSAKEEIQTKNPDFSQRFATGTRARMKEMARGVTGLYRDPTPEEKGDLDAARAVRSAAGPAANAGSAALDIATSALPLTRGASLASGLNVAGRTAVAGGIGGGLGALTTPDNRGKAAAVGAASSAIPAALAPLASKIGLPEALKAIKDAAHHWRTTVPMLGTAGTGHLMGLPIGQIAGAAAGTAVPSWALGSLEAARPGIGSGLLYGTTEEALR